MATYFKNRYRNESTRLQNWDYRWEGAYFITFCTKNRKQYFGEVIDGKMNLSSIGVIADIFWHEIKNHSKNVRLGSFVVMPDHIHGILIIEKDESSSGQGMLFGQGIPCPNRFQNIGKNSISSLVGSYKAAVTKHARRLGFEFEWQRLFYDHVIRDERAFINISNYIENNPKKWWEEKNENLKG
jgi:REP element-mobilizing transposase RayT